LILVGGGVGNFAGGDGFDGKKETKTRDDY